MTTSVVHLLYRVSESQSCSLTLQGGSQSCSLIVQGGSQLFTYSTRWVKVITGCTTIIHLEYSIIQSNCCIRVNIGKYCKTQKCSWVLYFEDSSSETTISQNLFSRFLMDTEFHCEFTTIHCFSCYTVNVHRFYSMQKILQINHPQKITGFTVLWLCILKHVVTYYFLFDVVFYVRFIQK